MSFHFRLSSFDLPNSICFGSGDETARSYSFGFSSNYLPNSMPFGSGDESPNILSEEQFIQSLLDYFRPHLSDGRHNYAMLIGECKERFHPYLSERRFSNIFFEMLFSFFEITLCTEYGVIQEALQESMFLYLFGLSGNFEVEVPANYHVDAWGSVDGQLYFMSNFFNPTIMITDLHVTRRFLRYGVGFRMLNHKLLNHVDQWHCRLLLYWIEGGLDGLVKKMALPRVGYDGLRHRTARQRRMYLVKLLVYVAVTQDSASRDSSASSLKLVLESIEDPSVTVTEITRFLNQVMVGEKKERKIADICEYLVEEFPDVAGCLQPRSLRHLSRCQVRNCMGKARTLPAGVFSLGITTEVEDYILIQGTRDEYYPKYVAALAAAEHSVSEDRPSKEQ